MSLEKDELRIKIKERSSRQKELELKIVKESEAVKKESSIHNDLLFVDVVDVYRSLPNKLLQFSSWFESVFITNIKVVENIPKFQGF